MKPSRVSDTEAFPIPARLTGTAINGGECYSVIPDLCMVSVDVRLTPAFDSRAGRKLIRDAASGVEEVAHPMIRC